MKKSILLIAVLLVGMAAQAQYFNVRDPLHSIFSDLSNVVPFNQKYYCLGNAVDSINDEHNGSFLGVYGMKFAVYDANGQKLKDTIYQRLDKFILYTLYSNFHQIDSSHFIFGACSTDTGSSAQNMHANLFVIDTGGHVTQVGDYTQPYCTYNWYQFIDLKPDNAGHWLMLCTIECSAGTNNFLLTKLDSSFHIIWTKQYATSWCETPKRLLVEPGGYLMAGMRDNSNTVQKNFYSQALLIKTDTSGNQLWEYMGHSGVLTGPAMDVIRTQDGGYVYCGTGSGYEYLSANGSSSVIWWRGWVEKIDSNRNVLWNHTIGPINSGWGANDQNVIKELANGDLMISGSIVGATWLVGTDTANINRGSLIKLDANGNTLWARQYATPQADTFSYFIYDMKPTPDGGFVMVGQAKDDTYPYENPTQRGWIIKVDSNGCSGPDDPQCWPLAVANTVKNNQEISVYPNPVTDVLQINNPLSNAMLLQLTDITGKLLLRQTVAKGHAEISLQSFSPGMYLYRFTDSKGYVQVGKLVKQ